MNSSPIDPQNAHLENNFVQQPTTQNQTLKPNIAILNKHSIALQSQLSFERHDNNLNLSPDATTPSNTNNISNNFSSISTYSSISTNINTTKTIDTVTTTDQSNSSKLTNDFNLINKTPESNSTNSTAIYNNNDDNYNSTNNYTSEQRGSIVSSRGERIQKSRIVIRKFQKLDPSELSSTPAPDVKIGQRIAYKEYYGNEFGTIRWIGAYI